jgi:hypothetical protein
VPIMSAEDFSAYLREDISAAYGSRTLTEGDILIGRLQKCFSRIEKSQFLTDRNVTKRAWGASWTTIVH